MFQIFTENHKTCKQIYDTNIQTNILQNNIIQYEYNILKPFIKSSDIKEFFAIKVFPVVYSLVYNNISKLQKNLKNNIVALKNHIQNLLIIKRKFKSLVGDQGYIDFIEKNHVEIVTIFGNSILEHILKSQLLYLRIFKC